MSDSAPPVLLQYEGEGEFKAAGPYWAKQADRHYVIGERYNIVQHHDRTTASHNHEFAWLKEAWQSLPEGIADSYPTPEHLRKRALIEAGYFDEQVIDAGTNAAALRVAAGVRSFPGEEFSLIIVRGPAVVVRRARSQSRRAMNRMEFQDSKSKVMEVVAALIGVTPAELHKAQAA